MRPSVRARESRFDTALEIYRQLDNQKNGWVYISNCLPTETKLQLDARLHSQKGKTLPIVTFSSLTDGLDSDQRSRDHFITGTNLENGRLRVPYTDGVWFHPCHFNVTSRGFSVVLKGLWPRMTETSSSLDAGIA